MKIVEQKVSIIDQEPGTIGMKKHVERIARVAYRSEDRITEDSYERFLKMLYNRGHWATFNLGTVYLRIPKSALNVSNSRELWFFQKALDFEDKRMSWNRVKFDDSSACITTNYRVICQLMADDIMEKYWTEPTENHYHRITSDWITSRSIAQQVLRHKVFAPLMESTRYCNYSIAKFDGEVQFVYPMWAEDEWNKLLASGKYDYFWNINDYTANDKWTDLLGFSERVKRRDEFYKESEKEYLWEISDGMKPEDARDALGMGLKTEFCICGYVDDYTMEPDPETPEKAGFFYLRTADDAQRDVRVLALDLKNQFEKRGLDKLQ